MSHPNPFAQNVPAQTAQPAAAPQQQTQQGSNPFAQQQAAPAAPQQAPQAYAPPTQYVPEQQAPPAAGNPFAQQQAAPQAYAPPAQQTYPHYGTPAVQQQAPAPAAVTPHHHTAPPALGTASAPPPPVAGGGKGAKLADMYGRLVVIFPMALQRVPKNAKFITDADRQSGNLEQDRMTATLVVLDGGSVGNMTPLAWGGNPHALGGQPHTESSPLPYVRKGMWLNQSQLIGQCSPYLPGRERGGPNGAPGAVVGRLVKTGPQLNDPWFITTPTDDELGLANQYLQLVSAGQFPHPLAP
jgi:hypothetical protein